MNFIISQDISKEDTDVTERYQHLVEARNEACEKLKKMKKEKKKSLSKDTRVLEARHKVQKAFDCYQVESTKENQIELQTKKCALQKMYLHAMPTLVSREENTKHRQSRESRRPSEPAGTARSRKVQPGHARAAEVPLPFL